MEREREPKRSPLKRERDREPDKDERDIKRSRKDDAICHDCEKTHRKSNHAFEHCYFNPKSDKYDSHTAKLVREKFDKRTDAKSENR